MTNQLKIIACITMLIDHVGMIFFPDIAILRIIGRIAWPAYCYMVAMSWKNTSDKKRYIKMMLLVALVSQIPYMLIAPGKLNVVFGLLMAILALMTYENTTKMPVKVITIIWLCITAAILNIDYSLYTILLVLVLYYSNDEKLTWILSSVIIALLAIENNSMIQLMAIPTIKLFELYDKRIKINKVWTTWYYPVHLFILCITKIAIQIL